MCWVWALYSKDSDGIEVAHDLAVMAKWLKTRWPDGAWAVMTSWGKYTEVTSNLWITPEFLSQVELLRVRRPWDIDSPKNDVRWLVHTRYATTDGVQNPHNSQPMRVWDRGERLKLAFNGNIPNHSDIRQKLLAGQVSFQTEGDTETLARFMLLRIQQAMLKSSGDVRYSIRESVRQVMDEFRGGYTVAWDFKKERFIFTDPYGIRPWSLWVKPWCIGMASEDHVLTEIGHDYAGEIPNGHLLMVWSSDNLDGNYIPEPENLLTTVVPRHPDSFEFVYLANRKSEHLFGVAVEPLRVDLGAYAARELLQKLWGKHSFDVAVSVPNGANDMKIWACRELGLPCDAKNWLTKVLDVRTFLATTQEEREKLVRLKFKVEESVVRGKNILLIDDSLVRGTTMKILADMLLLAGAKSVYVLIASPIVKWGDRYGIAMSTSQLIARNPTDNKVLTRKQIENALFCDRDGQLKAQLFFPSVEGFKEVFKQHGLPNIHAAYFDGNFING